mmetsp:Transcript_2806/g.4247  ORF Transcript_2806/g.4247 Transcript_2806/m.4247 type:complete len:652 (+) Transcript_2806:1-1956(+)
MLSFCSVESLFRRVFILILRAVASSPDDSEQDIAKGALEFLRIWLKYFHPFLFKSDVVDMKTHFEEFIIFISEDEKLLASMRSSHCEIYDTIHDVFCLAKSSCNYVQPTQTNNNTVKALYVEGTWDNSEEKKQKQLAERQREKQEKRRKASMEREKDKLPTIAVFGVTQDLLDEDDEDDGEEPPPPPVPQLDNISDEDNDIPEPRIPLGVDLLSDPALTDILSFDTLELARQWTLMDHTLFVAIPLHSLYRCGWTEPRHHGEALEVRRFIDRFNAESCWVTESILNQPSPQHRAELYMTFIEIAVHLESLNNFNGVMAILTALQQGCISRLKQTIKLVHDASHRDLSKLQNLMAASKNYQQYREVLTIRSAFLAMDEEEWKEGLSNSAGVGVATARNAFRHMSNPGVDDSERATGGIVPHLGAHLAELCSIEEGNPTYLSDAPHLLNMDKKRLFSRCLLQIGRIQRMQYSFHPLRLVQTVLSREFRQGQHLSSAKSAEWSRNMYNLSLQLEGRDGVTMQPAPARPPILHKSSSVPTLLSDSPAPKLQSSSSYTAPTRQSQSRRLSFSPPFSSPTETDSKDSKRASATSVMETAKAVDPTPPVIPPEKRKSRFSFVFGKKKQHGDDSVTSAREETRNSPKGGKVSDARMLLI